MVPLAVERAATQGKKKGVNGVKLFHDLNRKVVGSVKIGKLKTVDVRSLASSRGQQDAEITPLVTAVVEGGRTTNHSFLILTPVVSMC